MSSISSGGASVGANTALSNLGTTSINAHLLFSADNSWDVGSSTNAARNIYYYNLIGKGTVTAFEGPVAACSASGASLGKLCWSSTGNRPIWSYNAGSNVNLVLSNDEQTKSFTILVPTAADTFTVKMAFAKAITITRFYCSTDTGTATMNAEERAEATPNTAGTDVLSADIVCDSGTRTSCASGCDVNTISNGTIAAHAPLAFEIVSVASAPQVVNVHIDYTID